MLVTAVESTTLSAVAYDEFKEMLRLQFCSGARYEYVDVPAAVHASLLSASSKGRYFNQVIRGRYAYRSIPGDWTMVGAR